VSFGFVARSDLPEIAGPLQKNVSYHKWALLSNGGETVIASGERILGGRDYYRTAKGYNARDAEGLLVYNNVPLLTGYVKKTPWDKPLILATAAWSKNPGPANEGAEDVMHISTRFVYLRRINQIQKVVSIYEVQPGWRKLVKQGGQSAHKERIVVSADSLALDPTLGKDNGFAEKAPEGHALHRPMEIPISQRESYRHAIAVGAVKLKYKVFYYNEWEEGPDGRFFAPGTTAAPIWYESNEEYAELKLGPKGSFVAPGRAKLVVPHEDAYWVIPYRWRTGGKRVSIP
jgi:hypothetical protein